MTDNEAFDRFWGALMRIASQRGETPVNKLPGLWHCETTDESGCHWEVWLNGHREPRDAKDGATVHPFHAYVEFNGWPFGLVSPHGGTFGAGEVGNVSNLVIALEAM